MKKWDNRKYSVQTYRLFASFYFSYNTVKTEMQGGNTKMQLTPGMHMLAAAEAGILTLVLTNPIWVVKTR